MYVYYVSTIFHNDLMPFWPSISTAELQVDDDGSCYPITFIFILNILFRLKFRKFERTIVESTQSWPNEIIKPIMEIRRSLHISWDIR